MAFQEILFVLREGSISLAECRSPRYGAKRLLGERQAFDEKLPREVKKGGSPVAYASDFLIFSVPGFTF